MTIYFWLILKKKPNLFSAKALVLNEKQPQTHFASSIFDWQPSFFVNFSEEDIAKIIQNLDSNKAHHHDNIEKMWFFNLQTSKINLQAMNWNWLLFPSKWKKSNIVPIHDKGDNKHYPVSLLPNCGRFLVRLLLTKYSDFLLKIILFHRIRPDIFELISFYLSFMR